MPGNFCTTRGRSGCPGARGTQRSTPRWCATARRSRRISFERRWFAHSSRSARATTSRSRVFNRDLPLFVAAGSVPEILVRNVAYDPRSNRFDASVALVGSDASPVVVSGRVEPMVEVPVLIGHAMPGEVIADRDIQWTRVEARRAGLNTVTRIEDLVGNTPRRPIAAGQPIRMSDVLPNFVINKGDLVTVILKSGTMMLTARAEALQKGAVGDVIRVRNNQSRKVLETRVIAADTVTITGPQVASVN